jgi:hypothetical protein
MIEDDDGVFVVKRCRKVGTDDDRGKGQNINGEMAG